VAKLLAFFQRTNYLARNLRRTIPMSSVCFRPFTSPAYPALAQLNDAYAALSSFVSALGNLSYFGQAPGTVNPHPPDDARTKNGKVLELALRVAELPDLQAALRRAIPPVQILIEDTSTTPLIAHLAQFNVWGATNALADSDHASTTAFRVLKENQAKARAATTAAYTVAVRSSVSAA
jgi:hypothetical protein